LNESGRKVTLHILKLKSEGSPDFEENLVRIKKSNIKVNEIKATKDFSNPSPQTVFIDALFGTGLNNPLEGLAADLVVHINQQKNTKISIDIPSGLPANFISNYNDYKSVILADFTFSFQLPKQSFLLAETGKYVGDLQVLNIGLLKEHTEATPSNFYWIEVTTIKEIYKKRTPFSHKGTYGHALIIGGAMGMAGAVLMASKACTKAGAGVVTAFVPQCAYIPIQSAVPEVMVEAIQKEDLLDVLPHNTKKYTAIGIGTGMGTQITTRDALSDFMAHIEGDKLVIDADALNCLSMDFKDRGKIKLPAGAILTPHPKEFDKMFGESKDGHTRLEKQIEVAQKHKVYIVLKGRYTSIATPTGEVYFNSTGNAGMATGGSGDVLTGIVTALKAQGYSQLDACILGVYLHGLAGDLALTTESYESIVATDIINYLGSAFKCISA